MQQLKTKDENGNELEEKLPDDAMEDSDTDALCNERIKKMANVGVIDFFVKVLNSEKDNDKISHKVKTLIVQALCQISNEASVRGLLVQKGALSICCKLGRATSTKQSSSSANTNESGSDDYELILNAAHVVARSCITLNPNLLPPHTRLDTIKPLLLLCTSNDARELQQFETLLALTNILSVGEEEQEKFVASKGITAVHYLMFSENLMIRRAAVEALCNMASHDAFTQILCDPVKLRLWLVLCEDWGGDGDELDVTNQSNFDSSPHYFTARAAAGTLAMACESVQVTKAMCDPSNEVDPFKAIHSLIISQQPELILRVLVLLQKLGMTNKMNKSKLNELITCLFYIQICNTYFATILLENCSRISWL